MMRWHSYVFWLGLALVSCANNNVRPSTGPLCPATCANCGDQGRCNDCDPSRGPSFCQAETVVGCNPDGTIGSLVKTCDVMNLEHCSAGNCLSPCDVAAGSHSYIGCDYWPTTLLNAQLNPMFDFAVVVGNPAKINEVTEGQPASVKVVTGSAPCVADGLIGDDTVIQIATVDPGQLKAIVLPWIDEVSQLGQIESSIRQTDGAYHLCSSLPVTVYQFNPLQYKKFPQQGQNCPSIGGRPETPPCHSYTNDASTLLPTSTLGKEYIVASRGTMALQAHQFGKPDSAPTMTPGFFAVVGTEDNTMVTVDYSAYNAAGINIDSKSPGDSDMFVVNKGDVLQIVSERPRWDPISADQSICVARSDDFLGSYCDLGKDYDLTGTHILADKPIAVFGGHSCSFTPYNKWACDHLEQQMFPLLTWGQKALAAQSAPSQVGEPNLFRVISGSNGNQITLEGSGVMPSVMLDAGKWVEFVATGGVHAVGTGRLLIAQFMVGEDYLGFGSVGDPSMGLVVPVEQYRKTYEFLTPDTYDNQFVTVIAQQGSSYSLDGTKKMVTDMAGPIGTSGYSYIYEQLMPGPHHISSDQPFGIAVSGTAQFTSYLFPGGLNLNDVVPN